MRSVAAMFLPLVLLGSLASVASSQQENPPTNSSSSHDETQPTAAGKSARPRIQLLNANEGHEILAVTRQHEPASRATQDCSHLVHQIYERAGFPYAYVNSFDLYAGSENFWRVKNPQPGDLIVWPGHVGIVANPKAHLFYSLVRSGLDAEDYESRYWRSRGRARFYRYVVAGGGTLAATAQTDAAAMGTSRAKRAGAVTTASAATTPSTMEASERTRVFDTDETFAEKPSAAMSASASEMPRSIAIAQGRKQPTREEVAAAISELSNASGAALRKDAAHTTVPLIVFDQFNVSKVELKHDRGWAFVDLQMRASLWEGEANVAPRTETVRWELRRGKSGWEAVAPYDRTFVPRDVAVRNIAGRISDLTQQVGGDKDASRQEAARLTKLLAVLLEEGGRKSSN
jgi:hypothetical protein